MHFVSIFTFISCLLDVLAAPQRSTEQGRGNSDNINSIEPVDTSGDSNSNVNSSGNGSGPIIEANPEPDTEADPITSQEVDPVVEIEEPIDDASSNPRGEGGVVLPDDSAFPQFGENEVSPQMLNDFILYREFSAITFCPENNDSPGGPLSAAPADTENGCPRIAATLSNMKTVLEFEKYVTTSIFSIPFILPSPDILHLSTPKTDTTGYLVTSHLHKKHILAFRGTRSVQNVVADLKFVPIETDICPDCTAGRGFWSSWLDARDIVREGMKEAVEEFPEYEIVVTGHSLGGAVASLAAAQLRNDGYDVALVSANTCLQTFASKNKLARELIRMFLTH